MNQKLSNWASIAEIVSGVAVLVTLIFLIVGIRENTETVRASSYDSILGEINDMTLVVVQDERLSQVWRKHAANADVELDEDEEWIMLALLRIVYRSYEKAYFARDSGTLGEVEYSRFARQACGHMNDPNARDLWDEIASILTEDYSAYVEELCGLQ